MTDAWFPWLLSAVSCAMLWMMGNKSRWGPVIGLLSQALWLVYTLGTKQYGFLPGVAVYTVIHVRNLWRWTKKPRPESAVLPAVDCCPHCGVAAGEVHGVFCPALPPLMFGSLDPYIFPKPGSPWYPPALAPESESE